MSTPPKKTVYLAGPISGVQYGAARRGWRAEFADTLRDSPIWAHHIHCVSPMRGEELLEGDEVVRAGAEYLSKHHIENPKGILTRDVNDIINCDLMVANFLGADRVSIGTCAEFGIAHILRKPIVLVMEREGNPHHHGFITEMACYWVDSLEKAADVTYTLLTPGI